MAQSDAVALSSSPLATTCAPAVEQVIPARHARSLHQTYLELGKARLSAMVVVTTALGYFVADRSSPVIHQLDWMRLLWTCLGTFLAAVGAAAFNQAIEAPRDALMNRTRHRPIPSGEISRTHAAFFALLVSIAGVAILCPTSNGLTAILATANVLIYVLIYTPLKPISSANTLVGAVVGAIPPMMGWSAATGSLSAGAWALGAILFVWQIPHFLALAWMYRQDYARGGYKMVSTIEPSGRSTTLFSVVYSVALVPLALTMVYLGYAGWFYGTTATLLGLAMIALAFRFAATRSHHDARRLFFASILYLPLFCAVLILDTQNPLDAMSHGIGGVSSQPPANVLTP